MAFTLKSRRANFLKVNAYFYGTFGFPATATELTDWSQVLRSNTGSVWKPTGSGLQHFVSTQVGWGTDLLSTSQASARIDEVLANLFGSSLDIDANIRNYYIDMLVSGSIKERGLVNAVLNDLEIMPKVDGTYGKPNNWQGGPGAELLTQSQIDRYRENIEGSLALTPNTSQ